VIAARVRKYRLIRDWSVRRLAEECAKRGAAQLTAASLGNIERGVDPDAKRKRREVTVEELLILAYVLDVPPVALLLPIESSKVEPVPGVQVETIIAMKWIDGSITAPDALGLQGRPMPGVDWATYDGANTSLGHLGAVDQGRRWARWARTLRDGTDEEILEARKRLDARWKNNPDRRPVIEATARVNHSPQAGSTMSDAEWIAEWRKGTQLKYEERLKEYAEAIWRAADAGVPLPPVPRELYDDLVARNAELRPSSYAEWKRAGQLTEDDPDWSRTFMRPLLPPGVEVLEGDDDGDR
jgi:transcriptional regulator with XRE-family HTH domain